MTPYFPFFTRDEFCQHAFPRERSDLSQWRKRLGYTSELYWPRACEWRMRDARSVNVSTRAVGRWRRRRVSWTKAGIFIFSTYPGPYGKPLYS
jgi:hypothetical protein